MAGSAGVESVLAFRDQLGQANGQGASRAPPTVASKFDGGHGRTFNVVAGKRQ